MIKPIANDGDTIYFIDAYKNKFFYIKNQKLISEFIQLNEMKTITTISDEYYIIMIKGSERLCYTLDENNNKKYVILNDNYVDITDDNRELTIFLVDLENIYPHIFYVAGDIITYSDVVLDLPDNAFTLSSLPVLYTCFDEAYGVGQLNCIFEAKDDSCFYEKIYDINQENIITIRSNDTIKNKDYTNNNLIYIENL